MNKSVISRTQTVKHSVLTGILRQSVSLLLPFLTRSLIIYCFGLRYVGVNSLFASLLQVLNLAELGFGTAIVYCLYKPIAQQDTATVCNYLNHYRKVYRFIGVLILLIGILFIPLLPHLVQDAVLPGGIDLTLCYLIFLSDTVISYFCFGYMTAIPTAAQRLDLLNRWDIVFLVAKTLLQVPLLLFARSFYWYLVSMPVLTVARNVLLAVCIRRKFPEYIPHGNLNQTQKNDLRKRVPVLFLNRLFSVSRNSFDIICISAFISLAMAGIYSNYFLIMTVLISVSDILTQTMIPSVGNSLVTETPEKNYRDMRRFDFLYTWIGGWAAVCLLCLYQPFMTFWAGKDMLLDGPAVLGLSLYFYLLKAGDMRWIYHEGAGLWWQSRYIAFAEALANVILNIVLCRSMGIMGIILATLISLFFINDICCPIVLFRHYFRNGKLMEYYKDHVLYFLSLLPGGILCVLLCRWIPAEGLSAFLLRTPICIIVPGISYYLLWCKNALCREALSWLRSLIRIK